MNRTLITCAWLLSTASCASDAGPATGDAAPVDGADATPAGNPDAALAGDAGAPGPPPGLDRWITGDPGDAVVTTGGPGLILMGGGPDVDEAFAWQRDRINGGDIVILRTSGADGYNVYLHEEIGGVDSVETLLVDTRVLADDPYVAWTLARAEAIFMTGGDQSTYVQTWADTSVQTALQEAWSRGAILGGTSAGCAVLGQFLFSADQGTVYSDEALGDPYVTYVTLQRDFAGVPILHGVVTDTHFAARDRMGRLLVFLARIIAGGWATAPRGIGIDEATALVADATGAARVLGDGAVYLVVPDTAPATVAPGVPLAWSDVPVHELRDGDMVTLPGGATSVPPRAISAGAGDLEPADPY